MGKVRTRILGVDDIEQKQKEEQKKKRAEKQHIKKKTKAPGQKGGERMVTIEADQSDAEKLKKAEQLIQKTDTKEEEESKEKQKTKRKTKARIRGKKYQTAKKQVEQKKKHELKEAIVLLKKIKYATFDESVELHLNVIKAGLKGEVDLPNETGKQTRVKVVDDKVLAEIEAGKIEFDVLITHPSYMPQLAKVAKILGPRGLMPNPKTGTISEKPEDTAKKFQKGALRWKTEAKSPLVHQMVGKISQEEKALIENIQSYLRSVGKQNIKSAYVKTTMSPAILLDLEQL